MKAGRTAVEEVELIAIDVKARNLGLLETALLLPKHHRGHPPHLVFRLSKVESEEARAFQAPDLAHQRRAPRYFPVDLGPGAPQVRCMTREFTDSAPQEDKRVQQALYLPRHLRQLDDIDGRKLCEHLLPELLRGLAAPRHLRWKKHRSVIVCGILVHELQQSCAACPEDAKRHEKQGLAGSVPYLHEMEALRAGPPEAFQPHLKKGA